MIQMPVASQTKLRRRNQPSCASGKNVDYCQLETRRLLARTLVADFANDFPEGNQEVQDGWSYQWNAPLNGNSNSLEDSNFQLTTLKQHSSGAFTVDGEPAGTDSGVQGGFLQFSKFSAGNQIQVSGHPGRAGQGRLNRFAIASYTVNQSGVYSIDDSALKLLDSLSNDGVRYRVFVNQNTPAATGNVFRKTNGYFDVDLGYLVAGDTIHVAFGANGNHAHDAFMTDFSIYHHSDRLRAVTNYNDDFRLDTSNSSADSDLGQWRYLWNAPPGWQANIATGELNQGGIGQPEFYREMKRSSSGDYWSPDGDNQWSHHPDHFLRLYPGGGHPGFGYNNLPSFQDRYAIAAFTVNQSGQYALQDAWFQHHSALSDGVELRIHVDDHAPLIFDLTSKDGVRTHFDSQLGYLKAGSTIYFAFGANEYHRYDAFSADFNIVQVIPRALPDVSLREHPFSQSDIIRVAEQSGESDWAKINASIQEAASRTRPSMIEFDSDATYEIGASQLPAGEFFFELRELSDVLIRGNGATLMLDASDSNAYTRGMFDLLGGNNLIFEDLTIDYAVQVGGNAQPVSFTQGTIQAFQQNGAGDWSVELQIQDAGGELLYPATQFGHENAEQSKVSFVLGYAIDPVIPGRLKRNAEWHHGVIRDRQDRGIVRLGNGRIRVDLRNTRGLEVGDRFVLVRRPNFAGSIFSIAPDSGRNNTTPSNIVLDQIRAYSGPGVFLNTSLSENISLLNSEIMIRPGSNRWMSINADGVHAQSNRQGVWVENTSFEGLGDDNTNFYTNPNTIHQISEDGLSLELGHFYFRGLFQTNIDNFRPGERLAFIDPLTGRQIKEAQIVGVAFGSEIPGTSGDLSIRVTLDQPIDSNLLTLDREKLEENTIIYNVDLANGFYVANNRFTNSRRYGNFVMADQVQLFDNVYQGLSDQAIAGHTEHGWPLGLFASQVVVQGNHFSDSGFSRRYSTDPHQAGLVGFYMDRVGDYLVNEPVQSYHDLKILDNVFYHWSKTAISVRNASNVKIARNTLVAGQKDPVRDFAFEVQYSKNVSLEDNRVLDSGFGLLNQSGNENVIEQGTTNVFRNPRVWLKFDRTSSQGSSLPTGQLEDTAFTNRSIFNENASRESDGVFRESLRFDGNSRIDFNDGKTQGWIRERTVSVWIQSDDPSSNQRQVIYEEGSADRGLNIYIEAGRLYVGRWDHRGITFISVAYTNTNWNHVALVLDATAVRLKGYLGGREFGQVQAGGIPAHAGWISLGRAQGTRFESGTVGFGNTPTGFVGQMDDFRIYDSASNEEQIAALALRT